MEKEEKVSILHSYNSVAARAVAESDVLTELLVLAVFSPEFVA